jgi:hypothetical protein
VPDLPCRRESSACSLAANGMRRARLPWRTRRLTPGPWVALMQSEDCGRCQSLATLAAAGRHSDVNSFFRDGCKIVAKPGHGQAPLREEEST